MQTHFVVIATTMANRTSKACLCSGPRSWGPAVALIS